MDQPVNVTMTGFWYTPDHVVEVSEYVVQGWDHDSRVRVYRDLTSDVRSYEGGDERYDFNGESFTGVQIVRLAVPLAIAESKVLGSDEIASLKYYWGPQAWAELLSMQAPIATTVPTLYTRSGAHPID
jgi:hypothetical protein